jgi:hypothetical protein
MLVSALLAAVVAAAPNLDVPLPPPPGALPPRVTLPAGARGGALRVAIVDPRATGDVPARPLAAFAQALAPEVRKLEGVSAIGLQDIRDMLGLERQRQMLGCAADEACLAEIGGALGVDEMLAVDLTLVGKSYSLSARRIDMRRAKVIQSQAQRFERRDGEELLAVVGPMVAALFPDRPLKPGKVRGVSKAEVRRLNPPPLPVWAFVATAGASAVALGGGVVYGLSARDYSRQYQRLAASSAGTPVSGVELQALQDAGQSRQRTANVLFATAGGLAIAAGVEALFTDWRGDRAGLRVAPLALGEGGGGVLVAGRY